MISLLILTTLSMTMILCEFFFGYNPFSFSVTFQKYKRIFGVKKNQKDHIASFFFRGEFVLVSIIMQKDKGTRSCQNFLVVLLGLECL